MSSTEYSQKASPWTGYLSEPTAKSQGLALDVYECGQSGTTWLDFGTQTLWEQSPLGKNHTLLGKGSQRRASLFASLWALFLFSPFSLKKIVIRVYL